MMYFLVRRMFYSDSFIEDIIKSVNCEASGGKEYICFRFGANGIVTQALSIIVRIVTLEHCQLLCMLYFANVSKRM